MFLKNRGHVELEYTENILCHALRLCSHSLCHGSLSATQTSLWNMWLSKWKSIIKLIILFKIIAYHHIQMTYQCICSFQSAWGRMHSVSFSKQIFLYPDTNFSASNTYLFQEVCRQKERIIVNNKQLYDIDFDK